jgi:membrane protein YqaA with SNARE-associated domain
MTLLVLWFTTFAVCVVGAIIPFVNTEVYLISVSTLTPVEFVLPLVVAATVGQMAGKVAMYYAGQGILRKRSERMRRSVLAVRDRMEAHPRLAKLTLFSSAVLGLPPLYAVAIACGAIGMGLVSFVAIGMAGRFIHFAVVAMLPQYAKMLFGS